MRVGRGVGVLASTCVLTTGSGVKLLFSADGAQHGVGFILRLRNPLSADQRHPVRRGGRRACGGPRLRLLRWLRPCRGSLQRAKRTQSLERRFILRVDSEHLFQAVNALSRRFNGSAHPQPRGFVLRIGLQHLHQQMASLLHLPGTHGSNSLLE